MKTALSLCAGLTLLIAVGCSSPTSRIDKNRDAFASWPPAVQEKVQAGKIDLGFTPEQVRVALGDPDRTYTRTSNSGTSEVWAYQERGPKFGFGVGIGSGGGSSSYGGGVAVNTGGNRDDDALRVVFEKGVVSAVESSKQK